MLGTEIKNFFEKHPVLKRHFLGVFAADQVHRVLKRLRNKTLAVINTDVSSGPGKNMPARVKRAFLQLFPGLHWWVLLKLEKRLEAFDPLGLTEEKLHNRLGKAEYIYANLNAVQPDDSVQCGQYCCYWVSSASCPVRVVCTCFFQAYARLYNAEKKFSEVLNSYFTPNLLKNEAIITEFAASGNLFEEDE